MYTVIPAHEGWRVVTYEKMRGIEYHPVMAWVVIGQELTPLTMLERLPEGCLTIGPGDGVREVNGVLSRVPKTKITI